MANLKLHYFDYTGLAEPIRLAFVIGNIQFEDLRLTPEEWPQVKPTTPTGFVPVLEIDGCKYAESGAILAYACTKAGLWPTDSLDVLKMMQAVQYSNEVYARISKLYRSTDEQRPAVIQMFTEEVPVCLDVLNNLLGMKKDGGHIDMSDLLMSALLELFESKPFGIDLGDLQAKWPFLVASSSKVMNNEKVKAYYAAKK